LCGRSGLESLQALAALDEGRLNVSLPASDEIHALAMPHGNSCHAAHPIPIKDSAIIFRFELSSA
jgi:hypothetical protein